MIIIYPTNLAGHLNILLYVIIRKTTPNNLYRTFIIPSLGPNYYYNVDAYNNLI